MRDWITRRGIVAAERSGRRPYLIPAVEFTRPHPTQRSRPVEPEPMVTILPEGPDKEYRRMNRPLAVGISFFLALAIIAGALAMNGPLGPASLRGDSPRGHQAGVFVGETPLSVELLAGALISRYWLW